MNDRVASLVFLLEVKEIKIFYLLDIFFSKSIWEKYFNRKYLLQRHFMTICFGCVFFKYMGKWKNVIHKTVIFDK